VKKCDDLIALRSDAYVLTEDFRIELSPERNGTPPEIKLDKRYKFVDAMDTIIPNGVPSLKNCDSLEIKGEVEFAAGVVCIGKVTFNNAGSGKKVVAAGIYQNRTVDLHAAPQMAYAAPQSQYVTYGASQMTYAAPTMTYAQPVSATTYAAAQPIQTVAYGAPMTYAAAPVGEQSVYTISPERFQLILQGQPLTPEEISTMAGADPAPAMSTMVPGAAPVATQSSSSVTFDPMVSKKESSKKKSSKKKLSSKKKEKGCC